MVVWQQLFWACFTVPTVQLGSKVLDCLLNHWESKWRYAPLFILQPSLSLSPFLCSFVASPLAVGGQLTFSFW